MPTEKFNTHDYLAARQGGKEQGHNKEKDLHTILPPEFCM